MGVCVIGDIAGEYKTLMALIAKLPEGSSIVSLGDVVDRGPQSKEVVEYFMSHPEHIVLKGNHEWLLLNDQESWLFNGGNATLKSFGGHVPDGVKKWMNALPVSHDISEGGKKFHLSHTFPPDPDRPWREEPQVLWNRYEPKRNPGYDLMIAGHNAHFGLRWFADENENYAVGIDTSRQKVLTAIELPSLKIYSQPYI